MLNKITVNTSTVEDSLNLTKLSRSLTHLNQLPKSEAFYHLFVFVKRPVKVVDITCRDIILLQISFHTFYF